MNALRADFGLGRRLRAVEVLTALILLRVDCGPKRASLLGLSLEDRLSESIPDESEACRGGKAESLSADENIEPVLGSSECLGRVCSCREGVQLLASQYLSLIHI